MRAILGLLLACWIVPTLARDDGRYAQSPFKQWFENLQNQNGVNCCSGADGFRVEDPDWGIDEAGYWVRLDGALHRIEPQFLVKDRNRVGYAIVWPYVADGKTLVRCFMPGATS